MTKCKGLIFFLLCAVLLACSPKTRPVVSPPVKTIPKESNSSVPVKPVEKFTEASISLLIPFKLNQINLTVATKAQVDRADMAIDFYQGVKMGIDSAASFGLDFKVNVYVNKERKSCKKRPHHWTSLS